MLTLDIISFSDLLEPENSLAIIKLKNALLNTGIVGIREVPQYVNKTADFINAARNFSLLTDDIKQQYIPDRDAGKTEGYELGAEWFQTKDGRWEIDDKKASFYAFVPDHPRNIWPLEVDLKSAYLDLGQLIFDTGKLVLNAIGLNNDIGLNHDHLLGYGRMLHYHKNNTINANSNWCGAHYDHGVFTGLVPAYYFKDGKEIEEPEEAGLYIKPHDSFDFEKIDASDKSILLFQVGEFGQLIANDHIKATEHKVKKASSGIERFAFALFYSADDNMTIHSTSELTRDARFMQNQFETGKISYGKWQEASFERYRAKQ